MAESFLEKLDLYLAYLADKYLDGQLDLPPFQWNYTPPTWQEREQAYRDTWAKRPASPVVCQSSVIDPVQERQDAMARLAYRQVKALESIAANLDRLSKPDPEQARVDPEPVRVRVVNPAPAEPVKDAFYTLTYSPDGYAIGYKYLVQRADGYHSPHYTAHWRNNELKANGPIPSHLSPTDYGYGIYSYKHYDSEFLHSNKTIGNSTLVQLYCWGDILETEYGVRAEYAKIVMKLDQSGKWRNV